MPPEEKSLSTRPSQIRKRLQRTAKKGRQDRDIALYLEHVVQKPLEDWDLEELARGKARNKNGGFSAGRRLSSIEPAIEKELARRLRERALFTIRSHVPVAIAAIARLLDSEDDKTVFQAAKFIIEYTVGMPQQSVTVEGNVTLENMLAAALVLPDGQEAHPVIRPQVVEGELVDDGDEEDDDGEDL